MDWYLGFDWPLKIPRMFRKPPLPPPRKLNTFGYSVGDLRPPRNVVEEASRQLPLLSGSGGVTPHDGYRAFARVSSGGKEPTFRLCPGIQSLFVDRSDPRLSKVSFVLVPVDVTETCEVTHAAVLDEAGRVVTVQPLASDVHANNGDVLHITIDFGVAYIGGQSAL